VAQFLAIDGVGGHIALVVIDDNEALAGHGDQFRGVELRRWIQRAQKVAESGVD